MNFITSILSVLVLVSISGCKKPIKSPSPLEDETSFGDTITLGERKLLIEYGENQIPQLIFPLNAERLKEGYAFGYKENGEIDRIAHWSKGKLDGETYLFDRGFLKSKKIFLSGELVYQEDYLDQVKVDNQLYPQTLESFFFEDKYYAKIKFPVNYKGDVNVAVSDFQAVVRPLGQQTFQLVINDALDLSSYSLKLSYHPAYQDSLVRSDYLYTQVIFVD